MNTFKRIGVLTSGGDAPGMNAAIRAITRKALAEGLDVMGIMGGYSGLIHDKMIHLTTTSVSNIIKSGGTILNSDRCLEFKTEEGIQKAIETCKRRGIDAIVAIGGEVLSEALPTSHFTEFPLSELPELSTTISQLPTTQLVLIQL